jgi:phosphoribosylformimino-5-aminoimidazole carboxamide ribotide isomerase
MQVIPVIDLKNGVAVHAVKGQREHYRPLQSPLCGSAEPLDVLAGLLRLHPFRAVYLADLDALVGRDGNHTIIQQLQQAFPALEFWVDQGWPASPQIAGVPPAPNEAETSTQPGGSHPEPNARAKTREYPRALVPVLGSESMAAAQLAQLEERRADAILSLDFFGERFAGPPALLEQPALWPERVILMTLGQVGSQAGPDWPRLESYIKRYPQTRWIAAGGVRHADDLRRLAGMGIHAALVATALHRQSLSAEDLQRLEAKMVNSEPRFCAQYRPFLTPMSY